MKDNELDIRVRISDVLHDIGMSGHLRGYNYIILGVLKVLDDSSKLYNITKELYPEIAHEVGSTNKAAERCIRAAIETIFTKGNNEALLRYFKNTVSSKSGKPTNKEFIAIVS